MSHVTVQSRDTAGPKIATAGSIALWVVQIALAAFFVMGGLAKLAGAPDMVALFDTIGAGQWFRHLTGAMEVGGGVLLLVPGLAGVGALLLASVMAGAVLTHLLLIGGSAAMAATLLVVASLVALARRGEIARLAERVGVAPRRSA